MDSNGHVVSDLARRLDEFLKTEKGQLEMEKFWNKMENESLHTERWVERMRVRIENREDEAIRHLLNRYESKRYRDREYMMGYEPREDLLWILLEYAKKWGRECLEGDEDYDIYGNMFTGEMYQVGSYIIQVMHGQGSIVRLDLKA